ncbi:MAG: leucine-rich repeat domain-containing protein [Thermoguttaceae bacterium]|nr:leucine-rich repeat domain-containing protein [Thermoguttaceae bacterium]
MRTIERISKRSSSFIRNIKEICVRSIIVLSNFFLRKKKLRISAQMENIELNIEFAELYNKNLAKIIVSHDNPTYSSIDGVLYSKDGTKLIRFPPASKKSTFQVPDCVSSIENGAFWGCTSLNNINVSPNNLSYNSIDGVLYSKDGTELILFPPGSKKNTFQVPNSVTSIGEWAFSGCIHLIKLTIPDSVSSIENGAFAGCTHLTTIMIPDSVTSIGNKAFDGCESLTKLTIPNSVTSIGDEAFMDCTSLIKLTIPNSVTSIGEGAFSGCTSLTEITIPDSVTSIGKWAFNGCTHLTTITIPDSVTSIESYAFCECTSLTKITISDSVTSIGQSAFEGCTSLTEITIPDSVTFIGYSAFLACTSLTKIKIPDSVTLIRNDAFLSCPVTIIAVPGSCAWNYAQEKGIKVVAPDKE